MGMGLEGRATTRTDRTEMVMRGSHFWIQKFVVTVG